MCVCVCVCVCVELDMSKQLRVNQLGRMYSCAWIRVSGDIRRIDVSQNLILFLFYRFVILVLTVR